MIRDLAFLNSSPLIRNPCPEPLWFRAHSALRNPHSKMSPRLLVSPYSPLTLTPLCSPLKLRGDEGGLQDVSASRVSFIPLSVLQIHKV